MKRSNIKKIVNRTLLFALSCIIIYYVIIVLQSILVILISKLNAVAAAYLNHFGVNQREGDRENPVSADNCNNQ